LRSLPNRDVVSFVRADAVDRLFSRRLQPNFEDAPSTFPPRLQETGVETRLGASFDAQTFDRRFLDGASNAAFPPSFDDAFSPSCPNGTCPFSSKPPQTFPQQTLSPAPAGVLRSVVRVYNAYEETISTADAALGPTRRRVVEKGSGAFVADSLGTRYVLTAAHIFRDGRGQIAAQSLDGRIFSATLVLASEECDVALLSVDAASDVPALTISSSWPRQGETVWRAGFGPNETLKELSGVVKGYVKTDRYSTYETLKIDGPARQGDSGGPVYNASGEIVGVVWGTDGVDAYATYCGRVLKTLSDYSSLFAPNAVQADAPPLAPQTTTDDAPPVDVDSTADAPTTYAQTPDASTPPEPTPAAPPTFAASSKLRDFGNAALAFTVVFAFGYCGFFAAQKR
jgi:hypothetical protein